jgi:hypothetical protein
MLDRHRCFDFIAVLASRTAGSRKNPTALLLELVQW